MNPVKKAFSEHKVTFGSWIQLGHAGIAEILANIGFDWIGIDCEHTDIDVMGFTTLARGLHGRGSLPLARVKENDTLTIRQMLDAGAAGVIVPLINSADEARRVVEAAKYPPQGKRGFAFSRANNYGIQFDDYVTSANQETVVIVMIESKEAVESIDDILAIEGIDGIFIGPYDMSGSYGVTGQTDHPLIRTACRTVAGACQKAGKAAGIHVVFPTREAVLDKIKEGFTFIALGLDTVFLDKGARAALRMARETLA